MKSLLIVLLVLASCCSSVKDSYEKNKRPFGTSTYRFHNMHVKIGSVTTKEAPLCGLGDVEITFGDKYFVLFVDGGPMIEVFKLIPLINTQNDPYTVTYIGENRFGVRYSIRMLKNDTAMTFFVTPKKDHDRTLTETESMWVIVSSDNICHANKRNP